MESLLTHTAASPGSSFYFLCICVTAVLAVVRSTCPDNPMKAAMACTSSFGSLENLVQKGDQEVLQNACRNGDLFDAVNCIERVQEACKYDYKDDSHYLRSTVDPEKMRTTFRYFCTNINSYIRGLGCLRQQHSKVEECAREAFVSFKSQVESNKNIDARMKFQCRFARFGADCTYAVLNGYCSNDMATIVKTVLDGLMAKNCVNVNEGTAERTYDVDDGDKNGGLHIVGPFIANICCMVILSLLLIVFRI